MKISLLEHGVLEIPPPEVSRTKAGAFEVGALEVGLAEGSPGEICPREFESAVVRYPPSQARQEVADVSWRLVTIRVWWLWFHGPPPYAHELLPG
jgi:hypothetical protein